MKKLIFLGLLLTTPVLADSFECGAHTEYGIPNDSDQLLCRDGFAVGYNFSTKTPEWVSYKLTRDSVARNEVPRRPMFAEDKDIPLEHRSTLADYKGSGYDRGQLAPASSLNYSYDAMKETFLLSNITPQLAGFNRNTAGHYGAWGALEELVRSWAIERGEIYVISGPVFLGATAAAKAAGKVGKGVAIPSHFFKVIYDPTYKATIAFLIPHASDMAGRLATYITNIDCIELKTGFDFLPNIDSEIQDDLENGLAYDYKHWSMRDNNTTKGICPSGYKELITQSF